ncbi:MAG: heparan-alpha-glucosaminide N-acetyltransferase domain-containing protein [Myxococcota bacterium]|nr:heparan-alpha-glucosaminide N-acetyltransferase domain-containing protein [Myxococcota bacterium]
MSDRLAAIDWMRGLVMVLMTLDHASLMFNSGRTALDSAWPIDPLSGAGWVPGMELPPEQFFTRWVTHLCAPTFLFLSGTSLALSLEKRRSESLSESQLDRHLFIRGAVILGCEAVLSLLAGEGIAMLQVLYAIGLSLWLMIPLRRLDTRLLVGVGLGWFAVGEWLTTTAVPPGTLGPLALRLLLAPGIDAPVTVVYPVAGWLAMLAVGWGFGRWLLEIEPAARLQRAMQRCGAAGIAALALFAVVRGIDGYGNMALHRDDASLVQWLHVSKYPPGLSFAALELGLMALCLAACFALEARLTKPASRWNPLRVYGQTALFYYMLHFLGLGAAAFALTGGLGRHGLAEAYLATVAALVLLYPVCLAWRRYKSSHSRGWPQYV